MTLIVEDGTGVVDADSYSSVIDADAYFSLYGAPEAWDLATTSNKEVALRNASRYVDTIYLWSECSLTTTQGLVWPLSPFVDATSTYVEGIPRLFKEAVIELAGEHLTARLDEASSNPSVKSESYGDTSVTYSGSKSKSTRKSKAQDWLSRYGVKKSSQFSINRS